MLVNSCANLFKHFLVNISLYTLNVGEDTDVEIDFVNHTNFI